MAYATEEASCELCVGWPQRFKTLAPAVYAEGMFRIVECGSCGLVYVSPRLSARFRDACYEQETHVADWFRARAESLRRTAETTLGTVLSTGIVEGRWLDVGCGIGMLLDCAREHGFMTQGIEMNRTCASVAAGRHSVLCADVYKADIAQGLYDVITMTQVLEHVGEPLRLLKIVGGWLRPGGVAFIEVPRYDWLREALGEHLGTVCPSLRVYEPDDHLYYYRPATMNMLLESAGLRQVDASVGWTRIQRLRRQTMSLVGISRGEFLAVKCGR